MGEVLGRLHPLIVHIPVGVLILALLMQLAISYRKMDHLRSAMPFVFLIAIGSSILAWISGWIMPKAGEFNERLLSLHFWSSAAMTIACIFLYLSLTRDNKLLARLYKPIFGITIFLLGLAGHFGGSMTHGEEHLTAPLTIKMPKEVKALDSMMIYDDIITPILKSKCYSCHNESKKKGGLIMSTAAGLVRGGDNGPILLKADALNSPMLKRLHLPMEDEEHMPPSGKRQLTTNEIRLLEWWVENETSFNRKVSEVNQSDEVKMALKAYKKTVASLDTINIKSIEENTLIGLTNKGIKVNRQGINNPLLSVNLSRDTTLNSNQIKRLKKISNNINEIDLSYSSVDDQMIGALSKFKNLEILKLQGTKITSAGIKKLNGLEYLKNLNLYNTNVDDDCLKSLGKIKSLRKLYTWQTGISAEGLQKFRETHPLIDIQSGVDQKLFGAAQLPPPIIKTADATFEDSMTVAIKNSLQGISFHYTLDGSNPDSTNVKYEDPLLLNHTTFLKVKAFKEGWISSPVAEKVIIKEGMPIDKVSLSTAPSDKYDAEGAKTLTDLKTSSNIFSDGSWLGFEAKNLTINLTLKEDSEINKLVLGALEDTGSYIFFPKSISVYSSIDGQSYTLLKTLLPTSSIEPTAARYQAFLFSFESHQSKYLKIEIKAMLKNPDWHNAPGADNWLFLDEIVVN